MDIVKATEKNWKEVMDHFQRFCEALEGFQKTAPDVPIDLLGPELQLVYQASLQRKKPVWVIEYLEMELTRKGTISHLYPRQPEPEEPVELVGQSEEEQAQLPEEPPLEPEGGSIVKGKQSSSPQKKPTAQVAGEL